jgi:cell division protein ZapD
LILYEYPLNERIRTLLRLEDLFIRFDHFADQSGPLEHHVALTTLFEILEVASRADLKSDLLQELERQRQTLMAFRDNPNVSSQALERVLADIDGASQMLSSVTGKTGQHLRDSLVIVLQLLRESAQRHVVSTQQGSYQQTLGGKVFQMLQIRVKAESGAIPEISANKYMLWIRFTSQGGDLRPKPFDGNVEFELALCNL